MEIGEAMQWINENMTRESDADKALVLTMLMSGELTICSDCRSVIDADEECTICSERADRDAKVAEERSWDQHDLRDTRY